jgi:hypothetical protein
MNGPEVEGGLPLRIITPTQLTPLLLTGAPQGRGGGGGLSPILSCGSQIPRF